MGEQKMMKSLLCSRLLNVAGDWFYYFVIVIFIYNLNPSPMILGLLSLSYTLPGFLLSGRLAEFIRDKNQKLVSIYSNIGRLLSISFMLLTNNPLLVVFLVFAEQTFSITEVLAYKEITVRVISGEDQLEAYNRFENILSSISRLVIIPVYLLTINWVGVKFFLLLDVFLTLGAIIFLAIIQGDFSVKQPCLDSYHQAEGLGEQPNSGRARKSFPAELAILLFALTALALGISLSDAYGIMFIDEVSNSINIGYGLLVFIGTVAELLSSYLFKKRALSKRAITLRLSAAFLLLIVSAIIKNVAIFIAAICVIRFLFCDYDLTLRLLLQEHYADDIGRYSSIQIAWRDAVSFFNSVLGAIIIRQIAVSNYFIAISIVVILVFLLVRYKQSY